MIIDHLKYRNLNHKPRGRRPDPFKAHWAEMLQSLEAQPDQTAMELLIEFRARYPEHYSLRQLCTLERRVRAWRRETIQRLMCEMTNLTKTAPQSHDIIVPSANPPGLLPPPASDLTFCFAACKADRKETRKRLSVTSLMRQPVTKLREATRTVSEALLW